MNKQNFDVNSLRVASPCPMSWEKMSGDERARFCNLCQLNVYNISEMTQDEAADLIAKREGRLCIRLYKRADGTVLTKDCPVGFRAYQKRVARFAGATLATILGLFSINFAQEKDKDGVKTIEKAELKILKVENAEHIGILSGIITDPDGALVPGVEITITKKGEKQSKKTTSNSVGNYDFNSLSEGIYDLEIKGNGGFKRLIVKNLEIKAQEKYTFDIILEVTNTTEVVGIYAEDPLIDINTSGGTTTISGKLIDNE